MITIDRFHLLKDPHAEVWEDAEARVDQLSFCLWLADELIAHAELPALLAKLDAYYLNPKIAQSYPHLYQYSQSCLAHQSIYMPHFELRIVHFQSLSEVDLCFEKLQTDYAGEALPVWWCVTFQHDKITEVRWQTN